MEQLAKLYKCTGIPPWRWNVSHLPYPEDRPQVETFTEILSKNNFHLAAFTVTSLVAVIGNALVIWLIRSNRSFYTPAINLYIMSLAISDCMTGWFLLWMHFVREIGNSSFLVRAIVCKLRRFIQTTLFNASSFTLVAIAVDRFLAVKYPLKFKQMEKQHRKISFCSWLLSTILATPWAVYSKEVVVEWKDHQKSTCVEDWPPVAMYVDKDGRTCYSASQFKRIMHTVVHVARVFLPCAVMTVLYICIGIITWNSSVPGDQEAVVAKSSGRSRSHTRRMRVLRTAVLVMLAFYTCWIPIHVLNFYALWLDRRYLLQAKTPPCFPQTRFYCYCLAFANSAINPILYGGLTPEFREVLRLRAKSIICWWRNKRLSRPMGHAHPGLSSAPGERTRQAVEVLRLEKVEKGSDFESPMEVYKLKLLHHPSQQLNKLNESLLEYNAVTHEPTEDGFISKEIAARRASI